MDKDQKKDIYINQLKVVLAEKYLMNKWLADKFGKDHKVVYE